MVRSLLASNGHPGAGYLKAVTGQIVRLDDVDCADDQWLARLQQSRQAGSAALRESVT